MLFVIILIVSASGIFACDHDFECTECEKNECYFVETRPSVFTCVENLNGPLIRIIDRCEGFGETTSTTITNVAEIPAEDEWLISMQHEINEEKLSNANLEQLEEFENGNAASQFISTERNPISQPTKKILKKLREGEIVHLFHSSFQETKVETNLYWRIARNFCNQVILLQRLSKTDKTGRKRIRYFLTRNPWASRIDECQRILLERKKFYVGIM